MHALANFIERSSDALCFVDHSHHVRRLNPAFTQLLGWKLNPTQSFPISQLIHDDDQTQFLNWTYSWSSPQPIFVADFTTRQLTGNCQKANWEVVSTDETGCWLTVRSLEKEVTLSQNQLYGLISHDMRNLLGQVMGLQGILWTELHDCGQDLLHKTAEKSLCASQRLSALLDNLLSWTQQIEHNLYWKPSVVQLDHWLGENLKLYLSIAAARDITLNIENEGLETLVCDEQVMSAILRNLLANALKFTPSGGEVTLKIAAVDGEWLLSVVDSGVGITPAHLAQLLDAETPYVRRPTLPNQGTGLGLRLCQKMVQLYGGTLRMESKVGVGTTVQVSLPREQAIEPQTQASIYASA